MNRFVRFVFLVILLSSAMGFALVLVSNVHTNRDLQQRLNNERATITATYTRLNGRTTHAVFTVERQETSMTGTSPKGEVDSTTLLFGLCNDDYHASFVQRITVPGATATLGGIKLTFAPNMADEQQLLAGREFYLFDTVGGGPADRDPCELNPVGYPPLALRHDPPEFTDFEKQLWRPIWDVLLSPRSESTEKPDAVRGMPVLRERLTACSVTVSPGILYKANAGSVGLLIQPDSDLQGVVKEMLQLARDQDEAEGAGITRAVRPAETPKQ